MQSIGTEQLFFLRCAISLDPFVPTNRKCRNDFDVAPIREISKKIFFEFPSISFVPKTFNRSCAQRGESVPCTERAQNSIQNAS